MAPGRDGARYPAAAALIAQERALLAEAHEILKAFQASLERLYPENDLPATPQA